MAEYIVDRMIVADHRFSKALDLATNNELSIVIVDEVLQESKGDPRYDDVKRHSGVLITEEHIEILKTRVVDGMIDTGALLPDEGVGEVMIAAEYWYEGMGEQMGLFSGKQESNGKVVVTEDKKAIKFFEDNQIETIGKEDFFDLVEGKVYEVNGS